MRKLYVRLSDTLLLFCLLATATVWGQTPVQQPDGSWEVILTTTGAGTWTVPANVYEITVEAVGGGGGGARGTSSSTTGGGGGGGAYVKSTICTTPSTSISYSIGVGGLGGSSNKHGGDTWFIDNSTVLAKGGSGTTAAAGGAGGAEEDSIGEQIEAGESGAAGTTNLSGKGGNAGYTATVGSIGAGNTGAGGIGVTGNTAGSIGTNYGGGGSGGKRVALSPPNDGGAGAQGVIRITYYVYGDITSVVANPTYCAGEDNIQLTAVKNSNEGSFSTLWFEGGNPEIHFSNQFVSEPLAPNLTNTTVGNSNTEGVLRVTSTSSDPYITFDNIPTFDASEFSHISVRYKHVSGTVSNDPTIKHGATEVNGTTLEITGDWRITTFNISSLGNNITDFEFHWASDSGVILDLDYVVVANQPVIEGEADYTSVKTQDNTITVNTLVPATYYAVRLIETHCIASTSVQSIEIGVSPPATFDYGDGEWNIYVWNAADDDSSAQPWVDNYSGFLVIQNSIDPETPEQLVFMTNWESNQSPSYSSDYSGCYVNPNRHSFSARQTGFACGMYGLLINPEGSQLEIYINNEAVPLNEDGGLYSWSGPLTPEDEVEIRYNKGIGESSFLAFILSQETSPLEGGVINHLSPATICPSDVVVFDGSNTTPATGGALDPEDIDSFEYQWEVKFDDGDFEDIVGATGEFYTTEPLIDEGTYIYRRKVTDSCGSFKYTNEITIIRAELAPLQGGFINYLPSSVVCEDAEVVFNDIDPVTGGLSDPLVGGSVSYQWEISIDNGVTFNDIAGATEEFYTTEPLVGEGTYIYRRKVTDLCNNESHSNEITIIREELAALVPGVINYTGNLTVCPEEAVEFNDVTPATGGLTDTEIGGSVSYQWQVNYAGGGFENIVGATEEFYTTTQIEGGTYIYRRMVTDQCGAIDYTNEITITRYNGTPLNAGSINYATTTILCSAVAVIFDELNTTPASGGVTQVSSSLEYQWQVSTDNGVTFEDIIGATGEFYTTTDTTAGTYIYRRKVTDVACLNSVWTNEITIIRPDADTLEGGEITYTAPSTLCTPVTAVVFDASNTTPATGGGSSPDVEESLDYQWEVNYNGGGFEDIDGATGEFYTTTQEEEGTYIYRRKVTDWCENVSYTNEVTIIRSELDELSGGIINYLEFSLACIEDPVTFDDVTSATGGLTDTDLGGSVIYQWEVNYNDTGFADIVGATDEFHTTTETGAGTYIYRRKATDFCGNIAYTNQITITRTTFDPLVGGEIVNTGDQLVCPIQAVTFNNFTTPTGGHTDTLLGGSISYQWEVNYNGGGFEEITEATEEHYTTAQLGAGDYVYRRKATDQCGSTAYSNEITITRLEGDILEGGVISYTGPTTLCTPGEVIIFNNVTPATGGVNDAAAPTSLVYQWEVSHNGGVFVAIDGATSEFYTTTETASGTYIYRRKVTDTYCTNSAWTNEITINRSELSPLDGGTINYLESSVACPNASIQFNDITPVTGGLSDPGIGGSVTYQWEVSHNGGAFVAIVGATSEFYTTPIATPLGTYIYRRKATDFCGNIAYTNTITIIREELAPLAPGVITYTGLTIVCFGDIIVFDEVTSASGGLTASEDGGSISYQWEVSMDEGATFTDIVGATSEFYTSNEVGVGTYTYRRKVTDACGSEAWTNNITITRGGKIFTATNGNNWAEANNWNPIGVPSTADCVTIPNGLSVVVDSPALSGTVLVQSGGALTVTASGTLFITDEIYNQSTSSSFLVESGGNLIQENDVVNTGAITVERISNPMDTFNFTYWGAPVNTTLNNIAWYSESAPGMFTVSENSNISTSFTWNANTGSWDISQMPYMGTMEAGIGYLVKAPDSFITSGGKKPVKATFSGIPNNGDISVNIVAGNHNLLSNPYPSAIDIDKFLTEYAGTTTQGTIYLWSNGEPIMTLDDEEQPTGGFTYGNSDFATYTLIGGTGVGTGVEGGAVPSGYVASGQAFFVEGNTGGTVTFKNEYRYDGTTGYNNTLFFKTMNPSAENQGLQFEKHRFWLNLTGENTEFKQTLIGYADLATDGIDFLDGPQYDAGNPTNLYTTIDNTKYAIQAYELPFENTDETPLGYTVATAGTFTITLHAFDGLFDNQDIYIKDNVLNLVHNLKDGAYEFLTDAGTFENRFSVVYVPQGGLDTNIPEMAQNWIAYLKDGQIQLESLGFDMKEVYVYDMLGREIYAKQNINANQHTLTRVNGNQVLIVKVISTDNVSSVKKVQN